MPAWARQFAGHRQQLPVPHSDRQRLADLHAEHQLHRSSIIKLTDVGGWGKDADMHHPVVEDN
jgi:hypothetical protein